MKIRLTKNKYSEKKNMTTKGFMKVPFFTSAFSFTYSYTRVLQSSAYRLQYCLRSTPYSCCLLIDEKYHDINRIPFRFICLKFNKYSGISRECRGDRYSHFWRSIQYESPLYKKKRTNTVSTE